MPENTKDSEAIAAFARAVREAQAREAAQETMTGPRGPQDASGGRSAGGEYNRQESPDARTQRFLDKAQNLPKNPDMETPEERTERYRRKAIASQRQNDLEIDENGNVTGGEEPKTWSNLGQRMAEYPSTLVTPQSQEQKSQHDLALMRARNAVDRQAVPAVAATQEYGGPAWKALKWVYGMNDRARNPKPRDITNFERDDSEDMPIRKYTVSPTGKAIENAKAASK